MLNNFLFKLYSFFKKNALTNKYYFFLPNIGHGFTSEIVVTNYSQNSSSPQRFDNLFIALHTFDQKSKTWNLIRELRFDKCGVIIITSDKYTKKEGDLLVVSLHEFGQILPKKSAYLPVSDIKKNDFSPHSVRCRLLFKKNSAFTSYMAEYPKRMTFIKNGSAFSYGHLLANQNPLASTLILFVNISDLNLNFNGAFMKLFDVSTGNAIFSNKILPNMANVHWIENKKINKKSLALISQGLSGIPIFISEYKSPLGKVRLSCEHSHPPSEYFFSNPIQNQTLLKKNWFKKLL
jgi:hypothetical protein